MASSSSDPSRSSESNADAGANPAPRRRARRARAPFHGRCEALETRTMLTAALGAPATPGADLASKVAADRLAIAPFPGPIPGPGFAHSAFVRVGDLAYFGASTPDAGRELWATDGTPAGTVRITDINPAGNDSAPADLTPVAGRLIFSADDGVRGREIFVAERGSTRLLKDLVPGALGGEPRMFAAAPDGAAAVFVARDAEDPAAIALWTTDGTEANTRVLARFTPNPAAKIANADSAVSSSSLIAAPPGVWIDAAPPVVTDSAVHLVVNGPDGATLWKVDRATGQSTPLRAASPGGWIAGLAPLGSNGDIAFLESDANGTRLLRARGSNIDEIRAFPANRGAVSAWASGPLVAAGDRVFLVVSDANGSRLWATDGASAGTAPVDLAPGAETRGAWIGDIVERDGALHWTAANERGVQVWRLEPGARRAELLRAFPDDGVHVALSHDGTDVWATVHSPADPAGAAPAARIFRAAPGRPGLEEIAADAPALGAPVAAAQLAGRAVALFVDPQNPARSTLRALDADPSAAPLAEFDASGVPSSFPFGFVAGPDGVVHFVAHHPERGQTLWRAEPDGAGAVPVEGLPAGDAIRVLGAPAPWGDRLVLVLETPESGAELWIVEPGAAPRAIDARPGPEGSHPWLVTPVGDHLYFVADDGVSGPRLRVLGPDAREARTVPASNPDAWIAGLAPLGSGVVLAETHPDGRAEVRLVSNDASESRVLWSANPASSPNANAQPEIWNGNWVAAVASLDANRVLFATQEADGRARLWITDGTNAGTLPLAEIARDGRGGYPHRFVKLGDHVVFLAQDSDWNGVPWITDGTAAGTRPLDAPALRGVSVWDLAATPRGLVLAGWDAQSGSRLFRVAPDAGSGYTAAETIGGLDPNGTLHGLTAVGDHVLFVHDDGARGAEPWIVGPDGPARILADLNPGANSSDPREFVPLADGRVLFAARDGTIGDEPRLADLDAGTVQPLLDINTVANPPGFHHGWPGPMPFELARSDAKAGLAFRGGPGAPNGPWTTLPDFARPSQPGVPTPGAPKPGPAFGVASPGARFAVKAGETLRLRVPHDEGRGVRLIRRGPAAGSALPRGLRFDPARGLLVWTPSPAAAPGEILLRFRAGRGPNARVWEVAVVVEANPDATPAPAPRGPGANPQPNPFRIAATRVAPATGPNSGPTAL